MPGARPGEVSRHVMPFCFIIDYIALCMGGKSVAIGGLLLFAELQKQKYIVIHSLYSWLQSFVLVPMLEFVIACLQLVLPYAPVSSNP